MMAGESSKTIALDGAAWTGVSETASVEVSLSTSTSDSSSSEESQLGETGTGGVTVT